MKTPFFVVCFLTLSISAQAAFRADSDRLYRHVVILSSIEPRRTSAKPEGMARASEYIFAEFKKLGLRPTFQEFIVGSTTYRNVVVRFGERRGGARLVVGAHYDVVPDSPGADDNASGVAGLLEIARGLARSPGLLRRPVELVAYALEEPPHFGTNAMGSAVHARSLRQSGVAVELMIALEMIGYYNDAPGSQRKPFLSSFGASSDRGNFLLAVGRASETSRLERLRASFSAVTSLPFIAVAPSSWVMGMDYSDHRNYWQQGYPAVMVTDTAYLRNPHYHRASDRPETLDYHRMAQAVTGLFQAVVGL